MKYTKDQLEPNSYYYFKSNKWNRIIQTNSKGRLLFYIDFNLKTISVYSEESVAYPSEEINWEWRKATYYEIQHLTMCKLKNEFLTLNLSNYEEIY